MRNDYQNSTLEVLAPSTNLQKVQSLIGLDRVLLPVVPGEKRPSISSWTTLTTEVMKDSNHLASLEGNNIGVLLGQPSNGLCTIDVDSDEEAAAFLELNPALAETLQTRGSRGRNFWVVFSGDYPKLTSLAISEGQPWGELRSTGGQTVITGRHPSGTDYKMLVENPPITLDFQDIVWPSKLMLPWVADAYDELVAKEGALVTLTESGKPEINLSALAEKVLMENRLVYEVEERSFYRYREESGLYAETSKGEINNLVSEGIKAISDECGLSRLATKRTPAQIGNVVSLMEDKLAGTSRGIFSRRDDSLIHVQNGFLKLLPDEVELWNFHPDYMSRNQMAVSFDPEARCPRFLNDVLAPVLSQEDIDLFQIYGGSVLLGKNRSQKILLMTGAGGSGKSTVVNILERLVGQENVTELRVGKLDSRFELESIRGAVLLTCKDVHSDFLDTKNASTLKSLSGHDRIATEQKGGAHSMMTGDFHIIVTSNPSLEVKLDGDFEAWKRRLLLIQFQERPEGPVLDGLDETLLEEEGPGILNFFLEGALKLRQQMASGKGLYMTENQKVRVHNMLLASDSILAFASAGVEKSGAQVTSLDLYVHYQEFCESRGWLPKNQNRFLQEVTPHLNRLHSAKKSNDIHGSQRGYRGLQLKH